MDEKRRAIIAMSGGVDSSVAAYLMRERGFDCMGVTMKLFRNEDVEESPGRKPAALWRMWRTPGP